MIRDLTGQLRLALAGIAALCTVSMAQADQALPPFDYSGLYAGFSRTLGFGQSNWTDPASPATTGSFDMDGRGGGGIIGYNWRTGRTYFGVALDFTVTPMDGTGQGACPTGCETSFQNYVALRVQLGQRVQSGHLYGFAGIAMGRFDLAPLGLPTQERDLGGWLAGIGYEHPLEDGWTIRVELQYMDFEDTRYTLSGPMRTVSDNRAGMLRIGLTRYF